MRAMVLKESGRKLQESDIPIPEPLADDILVRVQACGVCRTDLHIVDGELTRPKLPLVPGHEIVGVVEHVGTRVRGWQVGDRVGVPWLGYTCGHCRYCLAGQENLCDAPLFTGYTRDGGYAEYAVADQRYCFRITGDWSAADAAPLFCAGLIGYRSYRMAGPQAERLGIYGFGGAAHIITQIAAFDGRRVFAFTKEGDLDGQAFALRLGAVWAGGSTELPPEELDAAIIFAPVGTLVPAALRAIRKGGIVVCGGIHMSDIPSFPYELLWGERVIRSVANLTRSDGEELLAVAPKVPVRTEVETFPLENANEALDRLRAGRIHGAAVLVL
jgi:propanol-preferring alcohol dehydrogenase